MLHSTQRNINNGVNNNCDCRQPRTLDESLRQYKRCNTLKNINTLDSSEYIKLYRSNLVSNNNLPTPRNKINTTTYCPSRKMPSNKLC